MIRARLVTAVAGVLALSSPSRAGDAGVPRAAPPPATSVMQCIRAYERMHELRRKELSFGGHKAAIDHAEGTSSFSWEWTGPVLECFSSFDSLAAAMDEDFGSRETRHASVDEGSTHETMWHAEWTYDGWNISFICTDKTSGLPNVSWKGTRMSLYWHPVAKSQPDAGT